MSFDFVIKPHDKINPDHLKIRLELESRRKTKKSDLKIIKCIMAKRLLEVYAET